MRHKTRDSGGKFALMLLLCCCAAILVYCLVTDWTRISYVIGFEISGFTHPRAIGFFRIYLFPLWSADLKMSVFAVEFAR